MIITKNPLRISFAGGGTDLPSFYENHEYGAVVSTSINAYIWVVVKKHSNFYNEKFRLNYSETEIVTDVDQIKNSIIRECLKFLKIEERLYIATIPDVPSSTGLGSSSTFCVGLLNALYKFRGISTSIGRIAEEAAYIEMKVLKRPIGKQDHYAAAFGGLNYFRFNSDGTVIIRPVRAGNKVTDKIVESMISFYTGMTRPAETVLAEQDKNNAVNTDLLIAMRDQADHLYHIMEFDNFQIEEFAELIHQGWLLKRKLASNISNALIDRYYEIAMENGAWGGKISGAGGGGFLNIFAPKSSHAKIINALKGEGIKRIRFGTSPCGSSLSKIE